MINCIILIGRITKEPELRRTKTGEGVINFNLAVNNPSAKDSKAADFFSCVAWKSRAEVIGKFCSKGSLIGIRGTIHNKNYTDAVGIKHYFNEVSVADVQLLDKKQGQEEAYDKADQLDNECLTAINSDADVQDDDLPF